MKQITLINKLQTGKGTTKEASGPDIVETRLRLPRPVLEELKKIAAADGLSMNAIVSSFIDVGLVDRGRKSVIELAPWFPDYLNRVPVTGPQPTGEGLDEADPDFT